MVSEEWHILANSLRLRKCSQTNWIKYLVCFGDHNFTKTRFDSYIVITPQILMWNVEMNMRLSK